MESIDLKGGIAQVQVAMKALAEDRVFSVLKDGIAQVQAVVRALAEDKVFSVFSVSSIHKYLKNNCDEWKDNGKDRKLLIEILKLGVSNGQLEQVNKFFKLNNGQKPQKSKKRLATTQAKPKDKKSAQKAKKAKKNMASSTKNGGDNE